MSMEKDFLEELFEGLEGVTVRGMFGGWGVYRRGLMFGLMSGGVLYLKTDGENLSDFTDKGLGPFQYSRSGKTVSLSFHRAPEEMLDDPELAAEWGMRAFRAAERSASAENLRPGRRK